MFEGLRVLAARSAFERGREEKVDPRSTVPAPRVARDAPALPAASPSADVVRARAELHGELVAPAGTAPPAPAGLRELDTQVRFSHWESDAQRREHTTATLQRFLAREGRPVDPDELFLWEQHFEAQFHQQQARNEEAFVTGSPSRDERLTPARQATLS